MQKILKIQFYIALRLLLVLSLFSTTYAQDSLVVILQEEMDREMGVFKKQEIPPYYMDYRVSDIYTAVVRASFGSLTGSYENKGRVFSTSLRVGGYQVDNTHEIKGERGVPDRSFASAIPFENDPLAIKQIIWQLTDGSYKNAVSSYTNIKNNLKGDTNDEIPDFSKEPPVTYFAPPFSPDELSFNRTEWEKRLKKLSGLFLENHAIFVGEAYISYVAERKYFVSTEGSQIAHNKTYTQLHVVGSIKSEDGNILPLYKSYFAFNPSGLPNEETLLVDAKKLVERLNLLKDAVIAEPYTGPAILSPSTAGVFFHEIFGHRIEGQRLKSDKDGQTFKTKIDKKVLPKFMNIISDPTKQDFNGQDLNGYYQFDDQGVKASKVGIVEKGILKNFLMSRCPVDGFATSNGHGRSQAGAEPVARQSSLIVETLKPETDKELRKKLMAECKKQGKEYGYYFKEVVGGFTFTNRYTPNVFNIMPTEVYRIYADGRPDELVRGVDLIGTPLAMFSKIEATGNTHDVFTGTCSAESGNVPVSAISPALFVKQIETQKRPENYNELPILPRPDSMKNTK